jgi:hypothetical protein
MTPTPPSALPRQANCEAIDALTAAGAGSQRALVACASLVGEDGLTDPAMVECVEGLLQSQPRLRPLVIADQ